MGVPLVTLTELKEYIGLVGTGDDALLASIASNATAMAERHTGRSLAVASNTTRVYSTEGQTSLVIHDRPATDSTRVIKLGGVTLTEETNVWLIPDRRNRDVVTTIQFSYYDTGAQGWYYAEPFWFDRNLDRKGSGSSLPNDLVITGVEGHPEITGDIRLAMLELCAWLYYRAKSGASGVAQVATDLDLGALPAVYQEFVEQWRLRTAVVLI